MVLMEYWMKSVTAASWKRLCIWQILSDNTMITTGTVFSSCRTRLLEQPSCVIVALTSCECSCRSEQKQRFIQIIMSFAPDRLLRHHVKIWYIIMRSEWNTILTEKKQLNFDSKSQIYDIKNIIMTYKVMRNYELKRWNYKNFFIRNLFSHNQNCQFRLVKFKLS